MKVTLKTILRDDSFPRRFSSGLQRCPLSRSEAPWSLPRGSSSSHRFAAASGEQSGSRPPVHALTPPHPLANPARVTPFAADLRVYYWRREGARPGGGEIISPTHRSVLKSNLSISQTRFPST